MVIFALVGICLIVAPVVFWAAGTAIGIVHRIVRFILEWLIIIGFWTYIAMLIPESFRGYVVCIAVSVVIALYIFSRPYESSGYKR
jgi:hypothetical protein